MRREGWGACVWGRGVLALRERHASTYACMCVCVWGGGGYGHERRVRGAHLHAADRARPSRGGGAWVPGEGPAAAMYKLLALLLLLSRRCER